MDSLPDILSGCKVFPCVPLGKLPATEHGWKEASSDPATLAQWQAANPDFNWAVATGLSDLFVIDIDPVGLAWWSALLERDDAVRAAVKRAFQVRTPRGGFHIYFRGQGPSTASRIADGIDTRGGIVRDGEVISGGYVLLPGSRTSSVNPGCADGAYEALPGGSIEPLPDCIKALIPERKKVETLGLSKNPDHDQPRNIAWAVDLLKGYVTSGRVSIEGRGGNNTAFQVAASILDKAISPALCYDLLQEHWNPHCSPPWEDWELETVIRNAVVYGEQTSTGSKGFQANGEVFKAFADFAVEQVPEVKERRERDRLMWLHEYADGVQDPTWLIPNVLPAQGIGMIYGESGSYKSFVALDMALCLAYGIPGQWGAPPIKNDVLFLAGEGPVATAKKRWPAWMQWQGIETRSDHRMILKDRVPFYTDTDAWEHIKADLGDLKAKPSLIVIDTLSRLITGMDENSAKDASMITSFMEALARYYECFVLAIHHTGKDASKGARGSSAFYANMDAVISTRLRHGGTELRVRKQKDADVADAINYFAVKEFGSSIVLERSDNAPEETASSKPRYDWASVPEVVKLLEANGGKLSMSVLVQEIASEFAIDPKRVRKQLQANTELTWLRPDPNTWEIPSREYDL